MMSLSIAEMIWPQHSGDRDTHFAGIAILKSFKAAHFTQKFLCAYHILIQKE